MEVLTRRREQEVWQACDDLWAMHGEIRELTGDAIRDRLIHLGKSRGSPNELYKYRKTWIKTRGLERKAETTALDDNELDPISRAVKLVHEQLKNEASVHLALLQSDFEQKLLERDQELAKAKSALDAVMVEFRESEHRLNKKTSEAKSLSEQREAEIEVRRASERETAIIKAEREVERAAHNALVSEIKTIHERELSQIDALHKENDAAQRALIDKLLHEKKQLGFEYSEKLNELRTIQYNQDIKIKQLDKSLGEAEMASKRSSDELALKERVIEALKEEISQLSPIARLKDLEINNLQAQEKGKSLELKRALHALKKSDVTIARQRAIIAHGSE